MTDKLKTVEDFVDGRTGMTDELLQQSVIDHLRYSFAKNSKTASADDIYLAMSLAIRDRLIHRWMKTMKRYYQTDAKRVYYLSAEYLLGRSMRNNLMNMGLYETAERLMKNYDLTLSEIETHEPDPGLGNGGLGRLAACFLDSLATLGYPAMGYGIRYEFGIFRQSFKDGWQVESRDPGSNVSIRGKLHVRIMPQPSISAVMSSAVSMKKATFSAIGLAPQRFAAFLTICLLPVSAPKRSTPFAFGRHRQPTISISASLTPAISARPSKTKSSARRFRRFCTPPTIIPKAANCA